MAYPAVLESALSQTLAAKLARNRYLDKFRAMSPSELEALVDRVLQDCTAWVHGRPDTLAACRDFLANACFALSIPLVEAALALYSLRDGLLEGIDARSEHQYGDAHQVRKFFDLLVLQLMRGY